MSGFYEPIFSDAIKDVIGDEPVLDQYDISYDASFLGSMVDDYITGSMLVETVSSTRRYRQFESRDRGRAYSKYAVSASYIYNYDDVRDPLQSYRATPPGTRVSSTAYRISQCFDSNERYYDSCIPNVSKCFASDGASIWSIRKSLRSIRTTNEGPLDDPSKMYALWSPVGNVTTHSVGFMYFNSLPIDRPEDGFESGFPGDGTIFTNNDWTWSYPYESKYSSAERQINDKSLGLDKALYVADWDGYVFHSITASTLRPIPVSNFFPILPGKLKKENAGAPVANIRNTFRAQYLMSSSYYGYKSQYPSDPADSRLDDVYGLSYLIPSDMRHDDKDDRANFLNPFISTYNSDHIKKQGPEPLTSSMSYDDTVKFLFGFGDLNNMTYGRRVFSPSSVLTQASGTFTLTNLPTATETVSISAHTYTFVTIPSSPDEVAIGTTVRETIDNLISAINGGRGEGTSYGAGTEADRAVSAKRGNELASSTTQSMIVTARVGGIAANSIATSDTVTAGSWAYANLSGGAGDYVEPFTGYLVSTLASNLGTTYTDGNSLTIRWLNTASGLTSSYRTDVRSWSVQQSSATASDPSSLLGTGSRGFTRQYYSISGSTIAGGVVTSADTGLWWENGDVTPFNPDVPLGPWDSKVLISDTDTLYSGDMSFTANNNSSVAIMTITSSFPWTLSYSRAIVSNTKSKFTVELVGERSGDYAVLDHLSGTATSSPSATSFAVMKHYDVRSNGISGSWSIGFGDDPGSRQNLPYPFPFDAGRYAVVFRYYLDKSVNTPSPSFAAVNNIRVIQYPPQCFPPDTGSIVGGNNYPTFRSINRDGRTDQQLAYDAGSSSKKQNLLEMPYVYPTWFKPSRDVLDKFDLSTKFRFTRDVKFDVTGSFTSGFTTSKALGWTYNSLIHSGTIFGVSPVIRGWKYGLYSGLPTSTKAVFRRDSYGQLRDMLEQRQYTKFVTSETSPFEEDAYVTPKSETAARDGRRSTVKQRSGGNILPGVVDVEFVKLKYTRDERGIGKIYSERVPPRETVSQNLSLEVTSSVPYTDGVARHRQESDLNDAVGKKTVTSFTFNNGTLTVNSTS